MTIPHPNTLSFIVSFLDLPADPCSTSIPYSDPISLHWQKPHTASYITLAIHYHCDPAPAPAVIPVRFFHSLVPILAPIDLDVLYPLPVINRQPLRTAPTHHLVALPVKDRHETPRERPVGKISAIRDNNQLLLV